MRGWRRQITNEEDALNPPGHRLLVRAAIAIGIESGDTQDLGLVEEAVQRTHGIADWSGLSLR
jgi:hypothetical protein